MDKIKNVESTGKLQLVDTRKLEIDNKEFFGEGLLDCYVVHPSLFKDTRGFFENSFDIGQEKTLDSIIFDKEENLTEDEKKMSELFGFINKENTSKSSKGTVRGMHYQKEPRCQSKLVRVTSGKAIDVVVDVRKDSPTFGKWFGVLLTPDNHRQLLVPKGFAHGFLALEDDTTFEYLVDEGYHKETEDGIPYDDKGVNINWDIMFKQYGITDVLTSEKDKLHSTLEEKVANNELTFTVASSRDTNRSRLKESIYNKEEKYRLLKEEMVNLKNHYESIISEKIKENEELRRKIQEQTPVECISKEQVEKLLSTYNLLRDTSNKLLIESDKINEVLTSLSNNKAKKLVMNDYSDSLGEC